MTADHTGIFRKTRRRKDRELHHEAAVFQRARRILAARPSVPWKAHPPILPAIYAGMIWTLGDPED